MNDGIRLATLSSLPLAEVLPGSILDTPADAAVVNLFEGVTQPGGATGAVDRALGGRIEGLIASGDIKAGLGKTCVLDLSDDPSLAAARLIVVGLGPRETFGLDAVRRAAAAATRAAVARGAETLATIVHGAGIGGLDPEEAAQATVEGSQLALYRFEHYKSPPHDTEHIERPLRVLSLVEADPDKIESLDRGARAGACIAAGVCLARDLANHPANVATPRFLADEAEGIAARHGMQVEVWDRDRIIEEGMGAFASVAAGSHEPPRFIILKHVPAGQESEPPIVLAGKAVTFDTGGISLKGGLGMGKMKFDMSGGAAVMGAMESIGGLSLPLHVVALIGATDNMPDGKATRPGDIVQARNEMTIEVMNTDAEGRMILADALSYAQDLKPRAVVDLATLTGAIRVALGTGAAGCFSNDDALADALYRAAEQSGERIWRLPIWDEPYASMIRGKTADLRNTLDQRPAGAGAIFAAKFLECFTDYPWAHLDIAGMAWGDEDKGMIRPGGTGFGVRLLVEWLRGQA